MFLQLNHLQGKSAAQTAQETVAAIYGLLAEGKISEAQFGKLRVQLDWLQYKQNFRDVVTAAGDGSFLDLRIDTRQIEGTDLYSQEKLRHAVFKGVFPKTLLDKVGLEELERRVPDPYLRSAFAARVSASFVYEIGRAHV